MKFIYICHLKKTMYLSESTIGELYLSLASSDYKKLAKYIKSRQEGELNLSFRLHLIIISLLEKNQFKSTNMEQLKYKLFKEKTVNHSRLTSQINILQGIFKEFILLSRIKAKNIYTETLWGEYLIENRLKRNLLIKQTNYKLDEYNDEYPFLKEYFHNREQTFLSFFNSGKNINQLIYNKLNVELESFINFELAKKIELYNSILSYNLNNNLAKIDSNTISQIIDLGSKNKYKPIVINSLVLKLSFQGNFKNYHYLKTKFIDVFSLFNLESQIQIASIILKFGLDKMDIGELNYSIENYEFYSFLRNKKVLENNLFLNHTHMNRYISLSLKHNTINDSLHFLQNNIQILPKNQQESCYNLNLAKIEFANKNHKSAISLLYQINTNLFLFYLPLTKILLLKNLVETEDLERLNLEKENFYKYYFYNKNLTEIVRKRYVIFHKLIEYMLSFKYEYLSAFMRKKITIALEDSSPFFTEKEWMKARWKWLEEKYG